MRFRLCLFVSLVLSTILAGGGLNAQVAESVTLPDTAPEAVASSEPPLRIVERFGTEPLAVLPEASRGARDQLEALRAWNQAGNLPVQNGFSRPLPLPRKVRLDAGNLPAHVGRHQGGLLGQSGPSTFVWGTEVRIEGARHLRLHLADVRLPPSARLWVYGEDGQARGPFGPELAHAGEIVTPSVAGPTVRLEVELNEEALRGAHAATFTVDRVTQLFPLDAEGLPILQVAPKEVDSSCIVDAPCVGSGTFPGIEAARRAVGQLFFEKNGKSFICTGALLNDKDPGSFIPYFLTANHCFDTQASASTLQVTWDAERESCGGSIPDSFPVSNGSTLLATNPESDFTFVRLFGIPPGRALLGWDARASSVPIGTLLHRISHPAPIDSIYTQSYSRSARIDIPQGCWNPQRHLLGAMQAGGTYGGSSGAPLMLPSGQVVGQLRGGCGPDPEDGCNYVNIEGDGWFGHTYGFIDDYLESTGGDGGDPAPPVGPWLSSAALPGFEAKVRIGGMRMGDRESQCIPETLCVSGALAGRPEIFVKVIGPRPNGFLWSQISRFTPAGVEIWLRKTSTGATNYYELSAVPSNSDDVSGLQDREAFTP